MIKVMLFTCALLGADVFASTLCSRLLTDADLGAYAEVLLDTEGSAERLYADRASLIEDMTSLRSVRRVIGAITPAVQTEYELLGQYYYLAVTAHARGWFTVADELTHLFANELTALSGVPTNRIELRSEVARAADRPATRDVAGLLGLISPRVPSIERKLLTHLAEPKLRTLNFGPAELELTKLILLYGHAYPGAKILELGAQGVATGIATEYRTTVRGTVLTGAAPSDSLRHWATTHSLKIVRGDFRKVDVRKALLKDGGFQVVTSFDQINAAAYPGVRGELFARNLRSLVRDHGLLILLNDFGRPPPFTADEALAAGFEIVAWDHPRPVDARVRPVAYGAAPAVNAGDLRAFVLRVGTEDHARIHAPSAVLTTRPRVTTH